MQGGSASIIVLLAIAGIAADDSVVTHQRRTATANAALVQIPASAASESPSFLIWSTLPDGRLKALTAQLEKQLQTATTALAFSKTEPPWPGKMAVYLFADRGQFRSFVRQVEKRSPDDAEQGSHATAGDLPHAAAGPGRSASAATPEGQAAMEVAGAVLGVRARNVPLPEWVRVGFGRAITAHAANQAPAVRKKAARDLLRARLRPRDAWNDEVAQEPRQQMASAVMDFLIFGGGAPKPADFLNAFRPDDEKPTKTAEDALAAVNLTIDQFETAFVKWVASPR